LSPYGVLKDDSLKCGVRNWRPQCSAQDIFYSSDGQKIVARYEDGSIRFWDVSSRQMVGATLQDAKFMAPMTDEGLVAIARHDGVIQFFDIHEGRAAAKSPLKIPADYPITAMAYAKGRLAVAFRGTEKGTDTDTDTDTEKCTGTEKGNIFLWNLQNGHCSSLSDFDVAGPLRFSEDGSCLFGGTWDRSVKVWTVSDAGLTATLVEMIGHEGDIRDIAVLDGGNRIATVSNDETTRIWNIKNGQEIVSLPGHSGTIRSVAVVEGENELITASEDGSILVRRIFNDGDSLKSAVCESLRAKKLEAGDYLKEATQLSDLCR
jgi:WD40 repeat protein